jgi:N-acetylneuraminate synthase
MPYARDQDVLTVRLGMMIGMDDYRSLDVPWADFSELLLFDGDLARLDDAAVEDLLLSVTRPIEFVHCQEFVTVDGEEVMVDLSSERSAVREASVEAVRTTRELAKKLVDAMVVMHPGGIRPKAVDHSLLMSNLSESLSDLGPDRLLLENMPWYYWFRKKERMVSNVCVTIDDVAEFEDMVEGFTLDMCHGYLSRAEGDPSYNSSFMERFGEKVMHVHASDAVAPDREGLQVGDGEVDFSVLKGVSVPVLVEIWNGHADGGAGFREGIDRLREMHRL